MLGMVTGCLKSHAAEVAVGQVPSLWRLKHFRSPTGSLNGAKSCAEEDAGHSSLTRRYSPDQRAEGHKNNWLLAMLGKTTLPDSHTGKKPPAWGSSMAKLPTTPLVLLCTAALYSLQP